MADEKRRTSSIDVTVVATRSVTPHMKRITFQGAARRTLPAEEPAWWVKVLLPAYTIRRFDRAVGAGLRLRRG